MTDALTTLSNVFYLISSALLIPVMLGLLFGLAVALLLFGRMLREWTERLSFDKERKEIASRLNDSETDIISVPKNGGVLGDAFERLQSRNDNPLFIGKVVADAEIHWQDELEKLQTWVRMGPAMGLMGTLIPLGPGLVALADGDLKTLSGNLIVAFATTVVGILIGLICGGVHAVRKRWYRADSVLLNYAAERFAERSSKEGNTKC